MSEIGDSAEFVNMFHVSQLRELRKAIVCAERNDATESDLEAVREMAANLLKEGFGGTTLVRLKTTDKQDLPACREEIDALLERVSDHYRKPQTPEQRAKMQALGDQLTAGAKAARESAVSRRQPLRTANLRAILPTRSLNPEQPPEDPQFVFKDEGKGIWVLTFEGKSERKQSLLGFKYIAELLAKPNTQIHVEELELVNARPGTKQSKGRHSDNREELETLKEALGRLAGEIEKARRKGESVIVEELQQEFEQLSDHAKHLSGLGGRPHTDSDTEKARSRV